MAVAEGISVDAAAAETEPDGIFAFKHKKIWERQLKAFLSGRHVLALRVW